MKNSVRAVLLLLFLSAYLFSWSLNEELGYHLSRVSAATLSGHQRYQVVNDVNTLVEVYTQPEVSFHPKLPVKFISFNVRQLQNDSNFQSESDHFQNNDLFVYHPITVYKISLSVHTSDD